MYWIVKIISKIVMCLPMSLVLFLGRILGWWGYLSGGKRKRIAYRNLRIAFGSTKSDKEIRQILKKTYLQFGQNIVEVLRLPSFVKEGIDKRVTFIGKENIAEAISRGKGVIILSIHSGNWELASLVGSTLGYPYNLLANPQSRMGALEKLLNEHRQSAGCKIIYPRQGTRELIRRLKANEMVCLVADQGGAEGNLVYFFGRQASMATGAIRLAKKYGVAICLAEINRNPDGSHCLTVDPPLDLIKTDGSLEEYVRINLQRVIDRFEEMIKKHPWEYMWFYKIWKYSRTANVLIMDDGRTGHLRQSQALAKILEEQLKAEGKVVLQQTVLIAYRTEWLRKFSKVMAFLGQGVMALRSRWVLKLVLHPDSYAKLVPSYADYVISCGAATTGINLLASRFLGGKTLIILRPGILSVKSFDLAVLPQHDALRCKDRCVVTRAALNLIDENYLSENTKQLLGRFSHLKNNYRTKIGVLIGGNTKNIEFTEPMIKMVIHQIKEVALQLNADVLLTTSRRTPEYIEQLIWREFKKFERCALLISAAKSDVPEAVGGILGMSDCVLVSGESISMVSEAISSGKKTVVFNVISGQMKPELNKYERFMENLSEQGYIAFCSVKGISQAVYCVMSDKMQLKHLSDRDVVRHAVKQIL